MLDLKELMGILFLSRELHRGFSMIFWIPGNFRSLPRYVIILNHTAPVASASNPAS